jgi:hypothetical protein
MTDAVLCTGLIYGPELHHLDHLAPLCSFMGIPLIVTEEKIAKLAKDFYPDLRVILFDYLAVAEYLVCNFDIVFYSIPRDLFDEIFFFAQKITQKKIHAIWCPHGNSDKGASIFYMEALKKEEAALLYGKQMIDFFQRKQVFEQLKGHVITGHFRYQFYVSHRKFYDSLVEKQIIRKLPKAKKTILYAPTWRDYENSSSFFDAAKPLFEKCPSNYNLIVKLHPNLILQEEFKVEEIVKKYEDRDNLLFLSDFTPINPLLNVTNIYIGDMSSIGYDFLIFNRPMFFLNQNPRGSSNSEPYLFRCGIEIKPEQYDNIHQIIANYFQYELRDFSEIRQEVYTYTFGHSKPLEKLKKEILDLIAQISNNNLYTELQ